MKKVTSLFLAVVLSLALAVPAFAYNKTEAEQRANELYAAGLFNGYGKDANGNPIFGLDDMATRSQGIAMFVRVLGKGTEAEQNAATYVLPFTDLPGWCRGYVGYAYQNGYTKGTSSTTFSPDGTLTGNQFLTFCLRSLGYVEGTDFSYISPNELAAKLGIIRSESQDTSGAINRGDMVIMAYNTLYVAPSIMETLKADNNKIMTRDFDAENNRFYSNDDINYYAAIDATKGMIITSDTLSRSSSGKEALAEYLADMESIFGEKMDCGAEMVSDRKIEIGNTDLSVSSQGDEYYAYVLLTSHTSDVNVWLNFVAYVTSKDAARAIYGICNEYMMLRESGYEGRMTAALAEKYGAKLVSDVDGSTDGVARDAVIAVDGYNVKILYNTRYAAREYYTICIDF